MLNVSDLAAACRQHWQVSLAILAALLIVALAAMSHVNITIGDVEFHINRAIGDIDRPPPLVPPHLQGGTK